MDDNDYHEGFEKGVMKVFSAMEANYEAWVIGFAPLAGVEDLPEVVRLFNMRPDITLFLSLIVFNSNLLGFRPRPHPCCIIQMAKDAVVPASVATYLENHLDGQNIVEMLDIEGHLSHLFALGLLAQVLE